MALLSIVTGTFNEEDNVEEFYQRIARVFSEQLPDHSFELVVADNASTDDTVTVLRRLAKADRRIKVIVNNRNFGQIRSGYHALMQARGEAAIVMASDLQDPPEMIVDFVREWEQGYKVVLAQKTATQEALLFSMVRKAYYEIVSRLSDIELVRNATGFGLYDSCVIEDVRRINDPYPYFRGLICDLGYERILIPFTQPSRKRGLTKNNFYTLWDLAMLGITNHSKVPLRLATFGGLFVAAISFLVAIGYFIYKLVYWDSFQLGLAPLVIGIFFIGAVQLVFVGLLGEYIGAIHTQVLRRPPVIEKERMNFD
jgi:polyisoprenyl-phosphate glycosyltransferase